MNERVASLWERLKRYSPGDVSEAAQVQELLEKLIVDDTTDFDDSALLSRALEQFSQLVKAGSSADWSGFFATLPGSDHAVATTSLEVDVEVLFSFLSEAEEHLDSIEERLLSLESDPNPIAVNEIFRSIHTIKGVAGFLNLQKIKRLGHEMEFLLDDLRTGARTAEPALVDVLLQASDQLLKMVSHLGQRASTLTVASGRAALELNEPSIDSMVERLQHERGPFSSATSSSPSVPVVASLPSASSDISDLLQSPELVAKFTQEALESLEVVETCFLAMEKTQSAGDDLNEAFRSIHTLKGNAGFFGMEALESLCMETETLLDALRKGNKEVDLETIEVLLKYLDRLRTLIQGLQTPTPARKEPEAAAATAESGPSPGQTSPRTTEEGFGKYTVKKKDIRVDTEKLDNLFDLIGELITAEAMVIDNPEIRGLDIASFARAATYLSKITRELQSVTMSIRMIPLEGLFSKMHRLVRDLGRKFGKDIELEVTGAETEMDRNIIEEISDPLVHIIRNAIDHGIEDTSERRRKGKESGGTIRLDARYEGNEIWITISDDGSGLDRDRILEVARSKGLVGNEVLTDGEVWKLIFEPGFSTAKQVSEISGRGVGMDVVKKNLEKLRGEIDIQTQKDRGTDFVLKIPLTLAIIDGVTLRSGTTLYSIPIADVVEFQNYQEEKVTQTDPDHRVLRLRDEILPVLPLSELFVTEDGSDAKTPLNKRVAIIIKSQGRKMAMIVDEIVGYKQIVLKALPESMAGLQGISGCTILGNGEVSLIIDVNALFSRYFA